MLSGFLIDFHLKPKTKNLKFFLYCYANRSRISKMLRTLIIDDEANIRSMINEILNGYCDEAEVVGQATGVMDGIKKINELQPDLVLLDIKMNDGTGFELLESVSEINFRVIFITAYQEFALQAIKFSALDYILKPVDPEELINAVKQAEKDICHTQEAQILHLRDSLKSSQQAEKKILLKTAESIHMFKLTDIIYCEADGGYTRFFCAGGNVVIVSNPLSAYDDMLTKYGFFRAHKSFLANLEKVIRFEREDGGYIVLGDAFRVPVASRKKDQLIQLLEKLAE